MTAAVALLACAPLVRAQSKPRFKLEVEPDAGGCIREPALRERIQRWLNAQLPADEVITVRMRAGSRPVSFAVMRGEDAIAERQFDVLPERCRDRLDALGLAIALAIEHAHAVPEARPQPEPVQRVPPGDRDTASPPAPPSRPPATVPERGPVERGSSSAPVAPSSPPRAEPRPDVDKSAPAPAPGVVNPAPRPPSSDTAAPVAPDRSADTAARSAAPLPVPTPSSTRPPPGPVWELVPAPGAAPPRASRALPLPSRPVAEPAPEPANESDAPDAETQPERAYAPVVRYPVTLHAGGVALLGVLPRTLVGGGELGVAVGLDPQPRYTLALELLISVRTDRELAGGRSHTQLFAGRGLLCRHESAGAFGLAACLGAGAGVVRAEGSGYAVSNDEVNLFWASALVRAAAEYPSRGTIAVRLAVDAIANLARPEVKVEGQSNGSARSALIGGAASLALIVRLE